MLDYNSKDAFSLALFLEGLRIPQKGLSSRQGLHAAEAAGVCIYTLYECFSMEATCSGLISKTGKVYAAEVNDNTLNAWSDMQETVEFGATAVAITMINLMGYEVAARSRKSTGFDYYIRPTGKNADFAQDTVKLEVSGILRGNMADLDRRIKQKITQMNKYSESIPGFAIVTCFEIGQVKIEK